MSGVPQDPKRDERGERPHEADILLYRSEDGTTRLEIRVLEGDIWLSLNQLAELFQRDKSFVSRHLKSLFDDRELDPGAVAANYATVQVEGGWAVEERLDSDAPCQACERGRSRKRPSRGGPRRILDSEGPAPGRRSRRVGPRQRPIAR